MKPLLVLLAALPLAAADAPPTAFFPPDTKVVIGINTRRFMNAALSPEDLKSASAFLAQTPLAGLDPFKDIDEVLIATTGSGEKPPAIAILRGRFHLTVPPDATLYKDVPLLSDPKQPEAVMALIDEATLIAGEPDQVRLAIDRVQSGAAPAVPADWLDRMETLRGKYILWGFGDGIEAPKTAKPGDVSSIDQFQFGASFEKGLRLAAEAHLRSAQDAAQMGTMLQFLHGMMLQSQGQKKPANGSAFDLKIDKSTVKLSLVVPEAELKKAISTQRTTLAKAFTPSAPGKSPSLLPISFMSAAAPAEPPKPPAPPPSDGKIFTDSRGDTVSVTLPVVKKD